MFVHIERLRHGEADCARESENHVPALALVVVNDEPLCLPHFLALLPVVEAV